MGQDSNWVTAAGDLDIYSIDRSANSWSDAEVDAGAAGADRVLSLDQLDNLFQKIWLRGGNPKVMLTGYDTLMRLQQLLQSQQRFMEEKRVTPHLQRCEGSPRYRGWIHRGNLQRCPNHSNQGHGRRTATCRKSTTLTLTTCTSPRNPDSVL